MSSLVKSQQRDSDRLDYVPKDDSLWKNSTLSLDSFILQSTIMNSKIKKSITFYHFYYQFMNLRVDNCYKHNQSYQLIGIDDLCDLNCRICLDCLKGIDNGHKKGVSNHETISTEQLNHHFQQLERFHIDSINECNEAVDKYFRSFELLMKEEIEKQKQRIDHIVRKILLTEITTDEKRLNTILSLYTNDLAKVSCRQVGSVADELFNFRHRNISSYGFRKFIEYIQSEQAQITTKFNSMLTSKFWDKIFLKNCQNQINFSEFQDHVMKASRVKTEEDSPKKTLRRSIKKEATKKLDLKDLSVNLRKPLELTGSKLVDNRDEQLFLSKLFDHKNIQGSKLLYRASENGFSVKEFHKFCDGQTNTLVLVKTEFNKIIGGFTPIPWKSTANTLHSDIKCESFLFSLSLKQKMNLIDEKSAIFNSINFGPTFGAGADLAICHNGNVEKTSYSEFPYSYANSRYKECNQHSTTLFTGQKSGNHFLLKEWEVWKIYFD